MHALLIWDARTSASIHEISKVRAHSSPVTIIKQFEIIHIRGVGTRYVWYGSCELDRGFSIHAFSRIDRLTFDPNRLSCSMQLDIEAQTEQSVTIFCDISWGNIEWFSWTTSPSAVFQTANSLDCSSESFGCLWVLWKYKTRFNARQIAKVLTMIAQASRATKETAPHLRSRLSSTRTIVPLPLNSARFCYMRESIEIPAEK